MTLTIQQIWERYSEVEPIRRIEVKRINALGVYETSWVDIETLVRIQLKPKDVVSDISYFLPNDTYSFGAVTINNASFEFENIRGELSNEENPYSIFNGFIRHKSLIRVVDGFIDKYTDPNNPQEVTAVSFEGFIDDRLCETTFKNTEKVIATDTMTTLLKEYTIDNFSPLVSTTIDTLIYEIMNRTEFTSFFTVSAGNISSGYNASSLDITQYDPTDTIFDLFQDLAKGHSIFYVRNNTFYFKAFTPTPTVVINFGEAPERKVKFDKYTSGASKVKDKLYWKNSNAAYEATNRIYNESYTFDIKAITNSVQQQNTLNVIGPNTSVRKAAFDLTIPFLPILFLLDRISIVRRGNILPGSFILDISHLDESRLIDPLGAVIISQYENWVIKGIKHTKKYESVLTVQKI